VYKNHSAVVQQAGTVEEWRSGGVEEWWVSGARKER
jgi:hypothetical protein